MLIRRKPGCWMPESAATPESVFLNRRAFMAASGLSVAGALLPAGISRAAAADPPSDIHRPPRTPPS